MSTAQDAVDTGGKSGPRWVMAQTKIGQMGWMDLTTENASAVRGFYETVVGWSVMPIEMEGYDDYCMIPPGSDAPVVGICHARGPNVGIPPHWIPYFTVADLERSLEAVRAGGGTVVRDIKDAGTGRFALIKDPSGAVCSLFQWKADDAPTAAPEGGG